MSFPDLKSYPTCPNAILWFEITVGSELVQMFRRGHRGGVAEIVTFLHMATEDLAKKVPQSAWGRTVCLLADREYDTEEFLSYLRERLKGPSSDGR